MKGKEALKQLEEKYHKYITEWYYMSNMSKEERDRLYKMYDEEIKVIDDELDKCKRAFEILKDKFKIQLSNDVIESVDMNDNPKTYYIYQVMFVYDRAIYAHDLEQKEHELLEELMKGA